MNNRTKFNPNDKRNENQREDYHSQSNTQRKDEITNYNQAIANSLKVMAKSLKTRNTEMVQEAINSG